MNISAKGFTLMELMVTIVIVAILAAIAIPSYIEYTDKAKYSEVIQKAASYKTAIATCGVMLGSLDGCTAGENGIPVPGSSSRIKSIDILNGAITATGNGNAPLNSTYELKASLDDGSINWVIGGTCREVGLC